MGTSPDAGAAAQVAGRSASSSAVLLLLSNIAGSGRLRSDNRPRAFLLVIDGKVKVCRLTDDNRQVVVELSARMNFSVSPPPAFLGLPNRTEWRLAAAIRIVDIRGRELSARIY